MNFLHRKILGSTRHSWSLRTHASLSARELESSRLSCEQDIRTSSILLLLHESLKRAGGRNLPLLHAEEDELISLPTRLDTMNCCILIVESQLITYMNQAAREHLLSDYSSSVASFTNTEPLPLASNQQKLVAQKLVALTEKIPINSILSIPSLTPDPQALRVHNSVSLRSLSLTSQSRFDVRSLLSCPVMSPSGKIMANAYLWDEWRFELKSGMRAAGRARSPSILLSEASSDQCLVDPGEAQAAQLLADEHVKQLSDEIRQLKATQSSKDQLQELIGKLKMAKVRSEGVRQLAEKYGPSYKSLIDAYLSTGIN